jgi:hypothetical protein
METTQMLSDKLKAPIGVVSSAVLDSVFDALVKIGGAHESMREDFLHAHMDKYPCREYRFMGDLGFGGKYWSKENRVSCYSEDETPKRLSIIHELNNVLATLSNDPN